MSIGDLRHKNHLVLDYYLYYVAVVGDDDDDETWMITTATMKITTYIFIG